MKAVKIILVLVLVLLGVAGWRAWRNDKARSDIRQPTGSAKGAVNQELVSTAERLAETLRRVQRTAQTNAETKK